MFKKVLLSSAIALSTIAPVSAGWKFETIEQKQSCQYSILKFHHDKQFYIDDVYSKFGSQRNLRRMQYEDAVREVLRKTYKETENACGNNYNMRKMNFDLYFQGYVNDGIVDYFSLH